MTADLHTHTSASDGQLSPAKLVELAVTRALAVLGITDHDTVAGLAEALDAGSRQGIMVIPGIELSTEWDGQEIHILGYYIDWQQENFLAFLATMRQARHRRAAMMLSRLRDLGYKIDIREVEQEVRGEALGRPHIAAALVRKGYAPSVEVAFRTLLERGRPAYVPRAKASPFQAVRFILEAGGVPVLAHPGLSQADSLIPGLVRGGLQGIEAYYPCHDVEVTRHYLELAANYNLVVTGGSDFHGQAGSGHADIGTCRVSDTELQQLQRRAQKIKAPGD